MAGGSLLRAPVNKTIHKLTLIAWGIFAIVRGLLAIAPMLLGWLQVVLWGVSLIALFWLLGAYNRQIAQWRVVIPFWFAYTGLRWLVTQLPLAPAPIVSHNLTYLVTILILDTLIAGYASLVILAIRRDVSLIYIVSATFVSGVALRSQVQAAGGVLNWLLGVAASSMQEGFSVVEPLMMMGSCMITLGIMAFLPHLLWLVLREVRGH